MGGYYQINDNNYISVDMNGRPLYETYPIYTSTYMNDQGKEEYIDTRNKSKDNGLYYSGNINYETKFPGLEATLFWGGQYSLFDKRVKSDIADTYYSLKETTTLGREQNYTVNAYSVKADYEQNFKNKLVWEIGGKVSTSYADTKMETVTEEVTLSHYTYNEHLYAGYTQFSGKLPYLSYSVGVRVETSHIRRGKEVAKENYTNYFPKASFSIPVTNSISLNLNYSKSVTRPNYSSSSQLEVYINPFYVISGNINLEPSITDEVSLNLQINKLFVGTSYYRKTNPIYFTTEYNDPNNLLSLIYSNYQKEEGTHVKFTLPVTYKFLTSTNTLTGIYNQVKDGAAVKFNTKPYLYYYSNNQFSLPAGYLFTLSGWGMTKRKEGVFQKNSLFIMDMALAKTFFGKLNCSLMVSDIFKGMKFNERFILNSIDSKGVFYADSRAVTLTLKYSFGKDRESNYKNQTIEENLYRMR
ncbi:MAG: outer membrane beta-barrel family protein [Bacteroides sp.]|nr:outer membrane beta-barrel family protein [Bacteroides sp.]